MLTSTFPLTVFAETELARRRSSLRSPLTLFARTSPVAPGDRDVAAHRVRRHLDTGRHRDLEVHAHVVPVTIAAIVAIVVSRIRMHPAFVAIRIRTGVEDADDDAARRHLHVRPDALEVAAAALDPDDFHFAARRRDDGDVAVDVVNRDLVAGGEGFLPAEVGGAILRQGGDGERGDRVRPGGVVVAWWSSWVDVLAALAGAASVRGDRDVAAERLGGDARRAASDLEAKAFGGCATDSVFARLEGDGELALFTPPFHVDMRDLRRRIAGMCSRTSPECVTSSLAAGRVNDAVVRDVPARRLRSGRTSPSRRGDRCRR